MSLEIQVFLKPESMPTPEEWQKAIVEREFDVKIDTDFDPLTATGHLPGEYKGEEAGFEYYSQNLTKDELRNTGIPPELSFGIDLRTGGGPDWYCAVIAGAVLAEITEGVFDQTEVYDGRWRGSDATWYVRNLLDGVYNHVSHDKVDYEGHTPLPRPELSFSRGPTREELDRRREERNRERWANAPSKWVEPPVEPPSEPVKKPWWKIW